MHADIPLVTAADITALLETFSHADVVIAPDDVGSGTNALLFSASHQPTFQFGENSCQKHMNSIIESNQEMQRIDRLGLALDIDEPKDLHRLVLAMELGQGGRHCRDLLLESGLYKRLKAIADEGFDSNVKSAGVGEG